MKPIDIPVVPLGPGSQPDDGDAFEFMEMPRGMFQHEIVSLPEPENIGKLPAARQLLQALHQGISDYRCGQPPVHLGMNHLTAEENSLINQILGEGEVSITVERGETRLQIQESVLTGLWRIQTRAAADGHLLDDAIEIADIPAAVREHSFSGDRAVDTDPATLPAGVQNSPALLVEIADAIAAFRPGRPAHVINLTLLPLTPEDLLALGERLGVGPTTLLSRGYGNCRIGATAKDNVWWIKYFNSQDVLILNTIEITAIPEVALAAQEDIDDSAERLGEITAMYG